MRSFADHACFVRVNNGISVRGLACRRLSDALRPFTEPAAKAARDALGDPFLPERSALALKALNSLPERIKQRILAADQGKRLKDTEAQA